MIPLKIRVKLLGPQFESAASSMGFSLRQSALCPHCLLLSSLTPPFSLFNVSPPPFVSISPLSGSGGAGGQRHHQLQATSYPAAGYPCQPVWLSHREGRGKDKGDQRGEQAEAHIYSILPALADGSNTET